MRTAFVIARKDLRQRLRDRSAILVGLVAPIGVAAIMSFAFGGIASFHYTLGVVDADHGPVASALVRVLESGQLRQLVTVETLPTRARAVAAVHAKKVGAALVIPRGFSSAAAGAHPEPLLTVADVDNAQAGSTTTAIASLFVAQLNANRLAVATALADGSASSSSAATPPIGRLEQLVSRSRIPLTTVQRPLGVHELNAVSYFAPAMAIFFLLFTVSFAARSFFVDRAQGMIERMRAAPVRPIEILAGKALSVFVYGMVSLGAIALITSLAFGANWGSPLAAGALCLALSICVVTLTALVIGLARTQRQAEAIASMIVFGLALLGGNFVFIGSAPALIRTLALGTPNGWALRGFTDLATAGGGIGSVADPLIAILAFSAVVGTVATLLAPRSVSP